MKQFTKLGLIGLTALSLIGTTIPALASSSQQPRGMIEEMETSVVTSSYNGNGKVYAWSQVNATSSSIILMDWDMYAGNSNATLRNRSANVAVGKKVNFYGIYNVRADEVIQMTHQY